MFSHAFLCGLRITSYDRSIMLFLFFIHHAPSWIILQAALLSRTVSVDSHPAPEAATSQATGASGAPGSSGSSVLAALRKRKEPDLPMMPRLGVKVQLKAKPKAKSGGAPDKVAESRAAGVSKADPAKVVSNDLDGARSGVEGVSVTGDQGKRGCDEGEATRQKDNASQCGDAEKKDGGSLGVGLGLGAYGSDDDDDDDNDNS
ncbi:unnamed protein product [Closterium sp. NIES-54]